MIYQNTLAFAKELDQLDPLREFRSQFLIPHHNGKKAIYFCGNSLGLQPLSTSAFINDQLNNWKDLAIEGFFKGEDPWLSYHKSLTKTLSAIVGAKEEEVTVMNSVTVNLHLMMVSFYRPTKQRYKILMEGGAFPSDQYAVESQARFHGYDPKEAIIEVLPREGEFTLRTADIVQKIREHDDEIALVLFGGVNYFTGQFFEMEAITGAAHRAGAYAGFDLAHAAGNIPLKLNAWKVDFATWCSYKYMNSGPGGISGVFVNEKHFDDRSLNRLAGWWGYQEEKRFLMAPGFEPEKGAAGWQVSTSPILLLAVHKAALEIFEHAGGMQTLRDKSILLTGYLEFLINEINSLKGEELLKIITPQNNQARGCQLSIVCRRNAKDIFNFLASNGVVGDWREPNVIRLSPVPLYNSFKDVFEAGVILSHSLINETPEKAGNS